jgi:hypothetical protein
LKDEKLHPNLSFQPGRGSVLPDYTQTLAYHCILATITISQSYITIPPNTPSFNVALLPYSTLGILLAHCSTFTVLRSVAESLGEIDPEYLWLFISC